MLASHFQYLVAVDKLPWCPGTAIKGAYERLPSILMTALVTALVILAITFDSDNARQEIMEPTASIIIGGMALSTILNLLIMPTIMLKFGKFKTAQILD